MASHEMETAECPICGDTFPAGVADENGWCEDCEGELNHEPPIGFVITAPPNPGQSLARIRAILSRVLRPKLSRCQRWGCALPVGRLSSFGVGPICDVCQQGLRLIEFPPRLNGGRP